MRVERNYERIAVNELDAETWKKAVAITHVLLREGCDEDRAIEIAIVQAKRWAETRHLMSSNAGLESNSPARWTVTLADAVL